MRTCPALDVPVELWQESIAPRCLRKDLVSLSTTCRSLREILLRDIMSDITLQLPQLDKVRRASDVCHDWVARLSVLRTGAAAQVTTRVHIERQTYRENKEVLDQAFLDTLDRTEASWCTPQLWRCLSILSTFMALRILSMSNVPLEDEHVEAIFSLKRLTSLTLLDCCVNGGQTEHMGILPDLKDLGLGVHGSGVEDLILSLSSPELRTMMLWPSYAMLDTLESGRPFPLVTDADVFSYLDYLDIAPLCARLFPNVVRLYLDCRGAHRNFPAFPLWPECFPYLDDVRGRWQVLDSILYVCSPSTIWLETYAADIKDMEPMFTRHAHCLADSLRTVWFSDDGDDAAPALRLLLDLLCRFSVRLWYLYIGVTPPRDGPNQSTEPGAISVITSSNLPPALGALSINLWGSPIQRTTAHNVVCCAFKCRNLQYMRVVWTESEHAKTADDAEEFIFDRAVESSEPSLEGAARKHPAFCNLAAQNGLEEQA